MESGGRGQEERGLLRVHSLQGLPWGGLVRRTALMQQQAKRPF